MTLLARAKNRHGVFIKPQMSVVWHDVLRGGRVLNEGVVRAIHDEGGMAVADVERPDGTLLRGVIVRYLTPHP